MPALPATCLIGTGGWEHESYGERLYPGDMTGSEERLRHYARYFDTVEVRATFWDPLLGAEDAAAWIASVADNGRFLFNVKLHSSFTHKKEIRLDYARSTRALLQELDRNDRLGALVLQFPYAFTCTSSNRYHLQKLGEVFRGFPLHAEFRHASWDNSSLLPFLQENDLAPVSVDLPRIRQYMPFIPRVVGETAYIRLHGRSERGWLQNGVDMRYDYLYNRREMREIGRRLSHLAPGCKRLIIIFNNTTAGKALANAAELRPILQDGKTVTVPEELIGAFPHLLDAHVSVDSTVPLFDLRRAM